MTPTARMFSAFRRKGSQLSEPHDAQSGHLARSRSRSYVETAPSESAARAPLGFDVEGIDGLAGGHEQSVAFPATEAEVGTAFR
jgi:hypothetical protein